MSDAEGFPLDEICPHGKVGFRQVKSIFWVFGHGNSLRGGIPSLLKDAASCLLAFFSQEPDGGFGRVKGGGISFVDRFG